MKYSIPKDELIVLMEFLAESREHLVGIEDRVLKLEVSKDKELINSIFRPIHTIKGTSSFLGLNHISELSHELETLLDDIRKGRITTIESDVIDIILEAVDTVTKMLEHTTKAIEIADHEQEVISTEIQDSGYNDIVNRVHEIRGHETSVTTETASDSPGEAASGEDAESPEPGSPGTKQIPHKKQYDYSSLTFPGEMKLQFEVEGMDQLEKIDNILLALEKSPQSTNLFNDLFRAIHTLKGNAGVVLSTIDDEEIRKDHFLNIFRQVAHTVESIVQKKRDGKLPLKANEIEPLFNASDCLKNLLECFKNNLEPGRYACTVLEQLQVLSTSALDDMLESDAGVKEIGGDSLAEALSNSLDQAFAAIENGLEQVSDDTIRGRALKKLKRSYRNLEKIGRKINHELLVTRSSGALNLIAFMIKGKDANESLVIENLKKELEELKIKGDRRKAKDLPDRRKATLPPPTADKELETRIVEKVLKVSQEKIDSFMNLIGELLVSKNTLNAFEKEVSVKYDLPEIADRLKEVGDTIARISNDLQTTIMEIRMLPVASAFSKFPRMIRDLSKKLKKKMKLEISGEETEIDKNIIEALTDPLVHMIRNAADHGIEPPQERAAAGKPEEGTIKLTAFNQGQYVVIRISDDGRGMDPALIKRKALQKGLIPPEELEKLDDQQTLHLTFLPGFSMAGQISDVSGRGVGMDVVKNNIEKLGGEAIIESSPGQGSTFTIKLPLTMAIGRGLEVESNNNRYYVPLESITETLRIPPDTIFKYKEKEMTVIRDELIPVYRLGVQLGLEKGNGNFKAVKKNEALVILNVKNRKVGLVVDNYYNETEYVIKPLTGGLSNIEGISGAMITGEGRVHLILDLLRLF